MFKLPYFLEGISNIFKPVLTDEKPIDEVKLNKILKKYLTK